MNLAGPRELPGFPTMFSFMLRRVWKSIVPRPGARLVPYDRAAMERNPSITWIGHSTMLVRMDGATFLTDPVFSERASPVSFAGPKRLVPPGVPLDALPPIDFALLSHDHYDHTDVPTIEALAKRGTRFIVPLELGDLVRDAGGDAVELDWWQHVEHRPCPGLLRAGATLLRTLAGRPQPAPVGRLGRGGTDTPLLPRR